MLATLMTASNANWALRAELHIADPIRAAVGQPTSTDLIARGLSAGVNRCALDAVLADLEAMATEIEHLSIH